MKVKIKTKLIPPEKSGLSLSEMLGKRGIYRVNHDSFPITRFIFSDGLALCITTDDDEEISITWSTKK